MIDFIENLMESIKLLELSKVSKFKIGRFNIKINLKIFTRTSNIPSHLGNLPNTELKAPALRDCLVYNVSPLVCSFWNCSDSRYLALKFYISNFFLYLFNFMFFITPHFYISGKWGTRAQWLSRPFSSSVFELLLDSQPSDSQAHDLSHCTLLPLLENIFVLHNFMFNKKVYLFIHY